VTDFHPTAPFPDRAAKVPFGGKRFLSPERPRMTQMRRERSFLRQWPDYLNQEPSPP